MLNVQPIFELLDLSVMMTYIQKLSVKTDFEDVFLHRAKKGAKRILCRGKKYKVFIYFMFVGWRRKEEIT